jgi:LysR family transcriptional regulator, transcriptional activator of nhaA
MEWLNYHHLFYFYTVAKEGSIAKAVGVLRLAQPTISAQIRALEENLGVKLFARAGRGLQLTEAGQTVYRYAGEIFGIGRELQAAIHGKASERAPRLAIGISELLPKLIAYRIVEPALAESPNLHLVCYEDRTERLLQSLSTHELDLVLSDAPLPPGIPIRAYNHLLGASPIAFFAAPPLAAKLRKRFPRSLNGAPLLLPLPGATLRRSLDQWFGSHQLQPRIAGEFQDSALMKVFGQAGSGIFAAPVAISEDVRSRYHVVEVGPAEGIAETYYAISVERRLKHPGVVRICASAREELFSSR